MFSGKTEELIRRLKRAVIGQQKVQIFKPRIDQRYEMNERTVYATVGEQAEEVQRSAARFDVRDALLQGRVRGERPVGDGRVDNDETLRHDASAADVDVSDLAVAHHACRQTHRFAARIERGVRIVFEHAMPVR